MLQKAVLAEGISLIQEIEGFLDEIAQATGAEKIFSYSFSEVSRKKIPTLLVGLSISMTNHSIGDDLLLSIKNQPVKEMRNKVIPILCNARKRIQKH